MSREDRMEVAGREAQPGVVACADLLAELADHLIRKNILDRAELGELLNALDLKSIELSIPPDDPLRRPNDLDLRRFLTERVRRCIGLSTPHRRGDDS
ncbi:MAG: hypothetical protein F4Y03_09410 [Alphaproteobacteria bacterium]|nr:hypothetical protein [Alphaproteobacteria bacterium]